MFIVTEPFNIAVDEIDANKSFRHSQVLFIIELVVCGTQCNWVQNT